jgi:hypothetical protein
MWIGMKRMTINESSPADDVLRELSAEVPKAYATRFMEIIGLIDSFCDVYLNAEYKELCREMAVAVCQDGAPVLKGKPGGWAAGIVYSVGYVNFLGDPSQTPHMRSVEIAEGFNVSMATMQAKARLIRKEFDLIPFHPVWSLPSMLDKNPMVSMATLMEPPMAGLMEPLRDAFRAA